MKHLFFLSFFFLNFTIFTSEPIDYMIYYYKNNPDYSKREIALYVKYSNGTESFTTQLDSPKPIITTSKTASRIKKSAQLEQQSASLAYHYTLNAINYAKIRALKIYMDMNCDSKETKSNLRS